MTPTDTVPALDWARARALAASRFGLGPREFWALSLADWRALCAPLSAAGGPPRRAEVDALCARFPDHITASAPVSGPASGPVSGAGRGRPLCSGDAR